MHRKDKLKEVHCSYQLISLQLFVCAAANNSFIQSVGRQRFDDKHQTAVVYSITLSMLVPRHTAAEYDDTDKHEDSYNR